MVLQAPRTAHRATFADVQALYDLPENADKRFELIDGVIYEVPNATPNHNWIGGEAYAVVRNHVKQYNLGFCFPDSQNYKLPNGDELIPDASFVSKARLSRPFPKEFNFAPDLAIEVWSPSNHARELLEKARSYLESGARLVWLIYPNEMVVDAVRLLGNELLINTLRVTDTLDGGDVLSGFSVMVDDLFPSEIRTQA
jgi:Uma2 family endonuclease